MTPYRALIESIAPRHGLDPNLVEAVVLQESAADPWAWNPEPRYHWLWHVRAHKPFRVLSFAESASEAPPADFPSLAGDRDQEWWGQQASWGLMQIMGAVAREHGYMKPFLPSLCDPEANIEIGCAHLAQLMAWAGNPAKALGAYNAGRAAWNLPAAVKYAQHALKLYASVQLAHPSTGVA